MRLPSVSSPAIIASLDSALPYHPVFVYEPSDFLALLDLVWLCIVRSVRTNALVAPSPG